MKRLDKFLISCDVVTLVNIYIRK